MSIDRLFVYGSLRSDAPPKTAAARRASRLLSDGGVLEGLATMAGRLHAVAWYPAFTPGRGARVRGEVWRIEAPGVLAELDAYEGADYVRQRRPVLRGDGRRATAWIYRYTGDLSGVPAIASGDYLQWMEAAAPRRTGRTRA